MSDPGDTRRLDGTAKERIVRRLVDRGPGADGEGGADPAEHERDAHAQGPVTEGPDRIHEATVVETRCGGEPARIAAALREGEQTNEEREKGERPGRPVEESHVVPFGGRVRETCGISRLLPRSPARSRSAPRGASAVPSLAAGLRAGSRRRRWWPACWPAGSSTGRRDPRS